jgi:hypothetical protein
MIRQAGKEEILQMSRRIREEMKRLSRPNKEHKVYP